MYLSLPVIATLMASIIPAASGNGVKARKVYCLSNMPDQNIEVDPIADYMENNDLTGWNEQQVTVPTYIFVIHSGKDANDVPRTQVQEQVRVMNNVYGPHGIKFNVQKIQYVQSKKWAKGKGIASMKLQLHSGDFKTLNLYLMEDVISDQPDVLGICQFPHSLPKGTAQKPYYNDGCLIKSTTLPGGSFKLIDRGYTAVHEVGHWFGLYHTFEGGCSGPGDFVKDTPPQKEASLVNAACNTSIDSCLDNAGPDQTMNFMDYSADACLSKFTPGQVMRMKTTWAKFRVPQKPIYADSDTPK